MRILHVIPSLDPEDGGPSRAVVDICRALREAGEETEIVTTGQPPGGVLSFPRMDRGYKYSPALAGWLSDNVNRFDIIHIHSVFNHSTHAAARAASRRGIPYIVRTLGHLNRSYALRQSAWKKRIYLSLFGRRDLDHAAALHCTSQPEKNDVERLGLRPPAVVIPLGLRSDEFAALPARQQSNSPTILFLGRIHPKKGFDLLWPALKKLSGQFRMVVAGPGEANYVAALREQAGPNVEWPGMVNGAAKLALLAQADIFVLPSYSENFGIAAAEAMACGIPVVLSDQVDLHMEVNQYQAGIVVPCQAEPLAASLQRLLEDRMLRERCGENGRRLVRERLDWKAIVPQLQNLYRKAMG